MVLLELKNTWLPYFRKKNNWKVFYCFLIIVMCSLGNIQKLHAQYYEYEIKGGFVYQFARFTTWLSTNNRSTFQIGILGENPFGEFFDRIIDGRLIHGKRIKVAQSYSINDLKNCQVIFVTRSEEYNIREIINKINNLRKSDDILIIGDEIKDFCKEGGMINFVEKNGNKYFFNVNIDAISRTNLILNSKVLKIAYKIFSDDQQN